jgi:hypothetical protein
MANYKVLEFNEFTGQLVVEYAVGMSPIAVDVPIKDGLYITGEELNVYVQGFIPTWYLERQSQINAGVSNVEELKGLVEQTAKTAIPTTLTLEQQQADERAKMWSVIQFERDVAKALIKFGVLTTDPTAIPVNELT